MFMKKEWRKLLSEGIYYSHESLSFYKGFYCGMGMDDIRELPTSINSFLHQVVDVNSLAGQKISSGGCVGRYRDESENDETKFDFEGYFTELIEVDSNPVGDEPHSLQYKASKRISKALLIASKSHSRQHRKSDGSPYLNHLIEVMYLLVNVGNISDEDVVIGGLLHDILEDTELSKVELLQEFGSRVTSIVHSLSDDKTLPLFARRQQTIEKLNSAPMSVKLIKLSDACSNASAIPETWTKERLTDYYVCLDQVAFACSDASKSLYHDYLTRRVIKNEL